MTGQWRSPDNWCSVHNPIVK